MFYQENPGFYVYFVIHGVQPAITFRYFEDSHDLFMAYREWQIAILFGDPDRIYQAVREENHDDNFKYLYRDFNDCYYAVYDENRNFYSSDRLVGMYREWHKDCWARRQKQRLMTKRNGCKKKAHGSLRRIKTTQERRLFYVDQETQEMGIAVKMRTRRNAANLPNSWDDFWSQTDKSWKTQSKRKFQWKAKKVSIGVDDLV